MTHVSPSTASSPALPLGALIHPPPGKRVWHSSIDMVARRTVLLHILVLLKTKYGKVDAKISYIARRAELALYSQAFSAYEYRNAQTLSRRLHSLVVKLHLNNLAAKEDDAFAAEDAQVRAHVARHGVEAQQRAVMLPQKRRRGVSATRGSSKRQRVAEDGGAASSEPAATSGGGSEGGGRASSLLFFDGNDDLLQHVSSFLDSRDILRCSATCASASRVFPGFVTTIDISTQALSALSLTNRALFFAKFPSLESFTLSGCPSHAQQFDFQNEAQFISRNVATRSLLTALSHTALPKLRRFGLNYAFTEGLQDRITSQVASVLLAGSDRFPRLQELSLRGNGISDDGAMFLYDALTLPVVVAATPTAAATAGGDARKKRVHPLRELTLEQNFIGERGFVQLKDTVAFFALRGRSLVIRMKDNLVAVSA